MVESKVQVKVQTTSLRFYLKYDTLLFCIQISSLGTLSDVLDQFASHIEADKTKIRKSFERGDLQVIVNQKELAGSSLNSTVASMALENGTLITIKRLNLNEKEEMALRQARSKKQPIKF